MPQRYQPFPAKEVGKKEAQRKNVALMPETHIG
jgi:hypothetical protein